MNRRLLLASLATLGGLSGPANAGAASFSHKVRPTASAPIDRPRRSSRYAARFVLGTARLDRRSLRTARRGLSIVGASLANA